MPRKARIVLPNLAHHVTQRGNYQQNIFEKDDDFRIYLYLIKEYALKYRIKIHAFCLMSNHVHFILTPKNEKGLAELFKIAHMRFSQYKNLEKRKVGHLWQGRFYSCVLSQAHLFRAVRYVEMNPVRANMVRKPWDYNWSSARQHLKLEKSPIIETDFHECLINAGLGYKNWREYLLEGDVEMLNEIRNKTQKGLVIGETDFIIKLERKLGIILRELKAGRPKSNR
jgi:putative transposase